MKKICVITTTRAEYGLMYWLLKKIQDDPGMQLQLVATGTHLSAEFGSTIDKIREDGFKIDRSFDLELTGDTPQDMNQALARAIEGFSLAFSTLKPDLITILGDRFEILGAASAALPLNIPVTHIHGGELSYGAIDDAVRHAVTKLSHLHFTATKTYQQRVIQMGENPERVFDVGGLGIDNINYLPLLSRDDLEEAIDFKLGEKNLMVTFHPETRNLNPESQPITQLISALQEIKDTKLIITYPNADAGFQEIIDGWKTFASDNPERVLLVKSLGQLNYLSLMQYVDGVLGNSSSGIIEAPTFQVGTINIGSRQDGRIQAGSILNCSTTKEDILKSVKKLYSKTFQQKLLSVQNPYGSGGAADKILDVLRKSNPKKWIEKHFYDLKSDPGV